MIPRSAHGTNPASANMAGLQVEYVDTDKIGGIDLGDLRKKVNKFDNNIGDKISYYPRNLGSHLPTSE